jgi:hypothetical protein
MSKTLIISETFDFKPSSREYLGNGFLRVSGKAARTGIYQYLAKELGLTDRDPNDIVKVYRPADEVFNNDSLDSYSNVDVTNDHPGELVDSKSYRNVSVGHVLSAKQDGDFVQVDMLIKDEKAIKDVESGKTQLSPGYTAIYDEAPDEANYDFIQRKIDINHVAIVRIGRGGPQARIFDNKPEEMTMYKVVLDSGRDVEIENKATASLVEDSITRLNSAREKAEAERDGLQAVNDSLTEQLEEAKQATSDEAIKARVAEVASTMDRARNLAGSKFSCDSVDPVEIKRAAMAQLRTKVDWNDKSAAYVEAAFDACEEMEDEGAEKLRKELEDMGAKPDELKDMSMEQMREKMKDMKSKKSTDALAQDLQNKQQPTADSQLSPREKMMRDKQTAYKGGK